MITAPVSVYVLSKRLNHRHREVCFDLPSNENAEDVGDDVAKNINKHETAETQRTVTLLPPSQTISVLHGL